jgi:hypothetical protein
MTLRKQQNHCLSYKKQLSYDETILVMQVTYRPYKRASVFRVSSSHQLTQSTSTLAVQPEVKKVSAHLSLFMTSRIQHLSRIRLSSSIYFLLIVSLLITDTIYGIRSVPSIS